MVTVITSPLHQNTGRR